MGNADEAMKEIDRILGHGSVNPKIRFHEVIKKAEGKMKGEVKGGECRIEVSANPAALLIIVSETLFSIELRTGHSMDEIGKILHELMEARRRSGD